MKKYIFRNWKYLVLVIILLIILAPSYLYFGSLDWSKKHSASVAALPEFSAKVDAGEFRLKVNNFEYLVRVAGMQNKGANLILLHGFPESSIMWENLLKSASKAGFRVLAFDQRGYSSGARPTAVEDYQISKLAADVIAVADKVGFQNFHLVGHDWGSVVGWKTVMDFPNRIQSFTAMSIPHPAAFLEAVLNDSVQKQRSSYFKFFQKSYLPEFLMTYNHQKNMRGLLVGLGRFVRRLISTAL